MLSPWSTCIWSDLYTHVSALKAMQHAQRDVGRLKQNLHPRSPRVPAFNGWSTEESPVFKQNRLKKEKIRKVRVSKQIQKVEIKRRLQEEGDLVFNGSENPWRKLFSVSPGSTSIIRSFHATTPSKRSTQKKRKQIKGMKQAIDLLYLVKVRASDIYNFFSTTFEPPGRFCRTIRALVKEAWTRQGSTLERLALHLQ